MKFELEAGRSQLIDRQLPIGRSIAMFQTWKYLLFLHWAVEPDFVQGTLPEGLQVDTFDGKAWIGIVPFHLGLLRAPMLPPLPGLSNFWELNLRTYALDRYGRPGVWFYSLDVRNHIAVLGARLGFGLPYRYAKITAAVTGRSVDFAASVGAAKRGVHYRYRPGPAQGEAVPGSLEFFLVERYRLFSVRSGKLLTGRIYHMPYRLNRPVVEQYDTRLYLSNGFPEPAGPPDHIVYSPRADCSIYMPEWV
jgi:uncharacterized protein YqjF (DUF2071 family)